MADNIKYKDTILYDKRRRSAGTMSVKRNAGRKQSDTQHKIDAMMSKMSHRIAQSIEYDKRKGKADTQREKRREMRRARKVARAQHTNVNTFKDETWRVGRQVRRVEM